MSLIKIQRRFCISKLVVKLTSDKSQKISHQLRHQNPIKAKTRTALTGRFTPEFIRFLHGIHIQTFKNKISKLKKKKKGGVGGGKHPSI